MNLNVNTISHLLRSGNFWSEDFMPVGIWDNSAIIATSNPDFKIPEIGIPCIIVRAEKKDLTKLFQEAFPQQQQQAQPVSAEPAASFTMPDLSAETTPNLEPSQVPDLQIPSMPTDTDNAVVDTAPEEPAFIPVEVGSISLDFSDLNQATDTPKIVEPPPPPVEEYEEEATKRFSVPPITTAPVDNVIPMPTPATSQPAPCTTSDWNLQAFLKSFDKVMFLDWKGQYLEVSKWLGNWEINPSATKKIDVSGNSIFKIPLKSTIPYHGYVVGNSINDSFFQNFNGGKTPEHISVFPVYNNDAFAGEIVCITTKAKGEKINLADYEPYLHKANKAA